MNETIINGEVLLTHGFNKINQSNFCDIYRKGDFGVILYHNGDSSFMYNFSQVKTYPNNTLTVGTLETLIAALSR